MGVAPVLLDMVGRREGRHPDDAATQLDAVIHRVPVDAAHRIVERHAGKQIDIEMAEMAAQQFRDRIRRIERSEEHTSELQSLMRISYAVFCLKKKNKTMKAKNIEH